MKLPSKRPQVSRYSAMLLFQFRVIVAGRSNIMRTCEKRLVVFTASSPVAALTKAKRRGRDSQASYRNDDGNSVRIEFVGVLDLLSLGPECAEDEVWYDIVLLKQPKERASSLVPADSELSAMRMASQVRSKPGSKR